MMSGVGMTSRWTLSGWRRKSPAAAALAVLLTLAQVQTALAAIVNTVVATGSFQGAPQTATATESVDVADASPLILLDKTATTAHYSVAGDVITYSLHVQNAGNQTLSNITLTDPGADAVNCPGGLPIASMAPGTDITCTASHTVTPADVTAASYTNSATAAATAPGAVPVSYTSTVTVNRAVADLVTVKTRTSPSATPAVGATVTYAVSVTNNGPEPATGVNLTDLLPAGLTATAGNGTATLGTYAAGVWTIGGLAAGQSATLTLEGTVDVGQGGQTITNTTTAAAGNQLDPGPAGDDLTESVTVTLPGIDAVDDDFTGTPVPPIGGTTASVLGNDTLGAAAATPALVTVAMVDDGGLAGVTVNADGTITIVGTEPVITPPLTAPNGTWLITYRICEIANPANCDDAVATVLILPTIDAVDDDFSSVPLGPAGGTTTSVLANDLLDGVAATPANVTPALVNDGGLTGVAVNADGTLAVPGGAPDGSYTVHYRICEIANPANCAEADALVVIANAGSISGLVYEDADSNGLPSGDPVLGGITVQLLKDGVVVDTTTTAPDGTYHFNNVPVGTGYTVAALAPSTGRVISGRGSFAVDPGETIVDVDLPIDPSGVVYDSSSRLPVAGATVTMTADDGTPLPALCLVSPAQQNQVTAADGQYRFDLVAGADPACPVGKTTYRLRITAPAGYTAAPSAAIPPQTGALDPDNCTVDPSPGGSCAVQPLPTAPVGAAATTYFLAFLLAAGDADVVHNHLPLDPVGANAVSLTKTADRRLVRRGEAVLYTITATNSAAGAIAPATITDTLPAGFRFIEGSAQVDGAPATPTVAGQVLTFGSLTIPANGTVTVTLSAEPLTTAGPGSYVNIASASGLTGPLAPDASATVEIRVDPVFDCSDIIGRVYEDANRNGRPDDGEKGLGGVRIATVKGTLITTDDSGRFHVPCAELPDTRIGTNFILKLDPRTLPAGYAVTTENPLVQRLTSGKMSKMNFGAARGREVALDVNAAAFDGASTTLKPEWRADIDQLVEVLAKAPSTLRITYRATADDGDLAERRIDALSRLVKQRWKALSNAYRLEINSKIVGPE